VGKLIKRLLFIISFLGIISCPQVVFGETLEEYLNNLVGPKEQYNTMLSPVYLRNNALEESISAQSGELSLAQTDYVLPGRNGLDLEIKRLYKSGISNVNEMKVKYVNGAWVDYTQANANTSSFFEDRYNLGIGMRFSFPAIEIRKNDDGSSHKFLHTEAGDTYRLTGPTLVDGVNTYLPENQTVKDVVVKEDNSYRNGQGNEISKYVMVGNNGNRTYFTDDGRVIGIVDRYGNTINFEYTTQTYTIDGVTRTKRLISKITDSVGRVVTIEYNEDYNYKAGPITDTHYGKNESWKESQNPNNVDSGELNGKFQVIVRLPGGKSIVYDKSAVLLGKNKNVIRTRLQRVFDVDGKPKYHYWYEQTDLGFTYANGSSYSVYNRYENLVQIDFCKTNQIKRYTYNTYIRGLADNGSLQYRKIFEKSELEKNDYDASKAFLNRFVCDVKDRINYTYTNEADGYNYSGYKPNNTDYLKNTYRYYTKKTDMAGSAVTYAYNGIHELVSIEDRGPDHKEVIVNEHDEKKFPKKKETIIYNIVNGQETGETVKRIENYRYDEFGNLTNYTGPVANRDENGYPTDIEHTVIYSYAYDKFHVPQLKTWKINSNTTCQIKYDIDDKGNVTRQTEIQGDDPAKWIITDYSYDSYGNVIKKELKSPERTYTTFYEYGVDMNGTDQKGASLTREYTIVNGTEISKRYAYDFNTGVVLAEEDGNGNRTGYEVDLLDRVTKQILPDRSYKQYAYGDFAYSNRNIEYTDPSGTKFLYIYDIAGNLLEAYVYANNAWNSLSKFEYDFNGNKIKETDANGNSVRFAYDSKNRLVKKTFYEGDNVKKAEQALSYTYVSDGDAMLLLSVTDEEGYTQKFYYDANHNLVKSELTPDKKISYISTFTYDYVGNKIKQTDARGNASVFEYDGMGRLVSKTDALGFTTRYTYNGMSKLLAMEEPDGRITEYAFDELGRVKSEKIYKKGTSDGIFTRYEYDGADNIISVKKGSFLGGTETILAESSFVYNNINLVTDEYRKVDDSRTAHARYGYDSNGRRTSIIEYSNPEENKYRSYRYEYDFAGRLVSEEGAYTSNGNTGGVMGSYLKEYEYDFAGNLKKQALYNGNEKLVAQFDYDYRNRLVQKTEPFTAQSNKITKYTYDRKGNLLSETLIVQGRECTTSYAYDGLGRAIAEISPTGGITTNVYDEMNNLIKQIIPAYYGKPLDAAPGMEYEYDALNRQYKVTAFDGNKREVVSYKEYDARGNVVKEADGAGYNVSNPKASVGALYEYDIYGNMTKYISAQTAADNKRNGTSLHTVKTAYDGLGRIVSQEDAYGNITLSSYYMDGKLKERIYPDGSRESWYYDLTGKIEEIRTDKAQNITRVFYNIFNKPYRIEYPDNTTEIYIYSETGNLAESIDRAGNSSYYEYTPDGNLTDKKEFVKSDGTYDWFKLTRRTYDEAGNILSAETFEYGKPKNGGTGEVLIPAGDRREYAYDKAGRLIKAKGPGERETLNEYDINGNLVKQMQKVAGNDYEIKRYTYDIRQRVLSEAVLVKTEDIFADYLHGAVPDSEYGNMVACSTHFEYYSTGNLKSRKDAAGNTTIYEYDYNGKIIKKTDPMQRSTVYRYDAMGNLKQETNAMGFTTTYDYDCMNRLIRMTSPAADGSDATIRYIYDIRGNMVKQILPNDYAGALDTPELAGTMPGMSYTYDCMNRCTAVLSPEGTVLEAVKYDAKGNVIKKTDGLRYNGSIESSPGTAYTYDGLNRVTEVTDILGNKTTFAYDIMGNMVKQTDARGNTTMFEYKGDGTLARALYADGGIREFAYDGLGRVVSEKDQNGNITKYKYNGFGKIKSETDPYSNTIEYKYDLNGNQASIKDKRGGTTLFRHDKLGRLSEKMVPISVDSSGNTVWSIERYAYDEAGNLVKKSVSGTIDALDAREINYTYYANNLVRTVSDNSGAETTNYYDKNGNIIKMAVLRDSGEHDIQKFEYDSMNRMTKSIRLMDEDDIFNAASIPNVSNLRDSEHPGKIRLVTAYEYDAIGNKTKEIHPKAFGYTEGDTVNRDNYSVFYSYDLLNRLEKIAWRHNGSEVYTRYVYDETGNRIKTIDERGFETTYEYDSMNRLISSADPMGGVWSYTYDLAGNMLSETNPKGDTISYAYDKLNRIETVTDPYGVIITRNSYDANGNILETKDSKGCATTYAYDLANRLIMVTDPEAADKGSYTEKIEYNQYGEKVKVTDALGNETAYAYDAAGRLIVVTDALGTDTQYGYDKAGNKLYTVDGRGKTTSYSCGAFGVLRSMTDAEGMSMIYAYDLAGNTEAVTDRNGNITIYTYDNRNRLTEKICASTGDRIGYSYDSAGNRTSMTDDSGSTVYTYDGNNRLTRVEKDGALQVAYGYDAVGNVTSVTDSKGNTTSYTYDKSSRMKTVSFGGKTVTYAYDTNGNRTSVTYDGGVKEEYTYDKNNRLLTLVNTGPDGREISRYSYTYDLAGRQTSKTDSYGTSTYTYDAAGRVIKAETPGKTTIYAYDAAGNRISASETYASAQSTGFTDEVSGIGAEYILKKSQYAYSASNRLVKLVEEMYDNGNNKVLTRTVQYTYDANGNQLSEYAGFTHPNNTNYTRTISASAYGDNQQAEPDVLIDRTSNTYDGFNRLVRAEKIEAGVRTVTEYTYNGDDLRVRKTVRKSDSGYTPQVTCFLYDRQHVILETDGSGNTVTRYIRGINYIAQYSGTEFSYYLYNGHGDVVQTVSASGEILNHYDYDIFGNPVLTIETAACSIRYAGEYLDKETGLYYLRARYYNPYIGRFISEDSYWGEDDNPLSLNLYTYCFNDPIRFIDPTGHDPYDEIIANAKTQSQINWIINEMDDQKEKWFAEEQGAGKDQKMLTQNQINANYRASQLRAQLLSLEKGNPDLQNLIRDDEKGKAGAWEQYKVIKAIQDIESDVIIDSKIDSKKVNLLYERTKDAIISSNLNIHIHGIDKSVITEESMTQIEKAAREFVSGELKRIAIAKLKHAWDNPGKTADEITQNITEIIENKFITEDDPEFVQFAYKAIKYIGVRYIAVNVMVADYAKGIEELVKYLAKAYHRYSPEGISMNAMISEMKSGGDSKKAFLYFIEAQFGPDWEMIKGIFTGIVDDFKTVLDKEKAYKFFLDSNAKPSEIAEYGESLINAVSVSIVAGKLSTAAVKAGITAAKKIRLKPNVVIKDGITSYIDDAANAADDIARMARESVDDIIEGTSKTANDILSNKTLTNQTGKVDNYVSDVKGYDAALKDFNALKPNNVKIYSNGTIVGDLPDGRTINLHPSTSLKGTPTVEIRDPSIGRSIKIRY
jgi:RHS repeat-associated protein